MPLYGHIARNGQAPAGAAVSALAAAIAAFGIWRGIAAKSSAGRRRWPLAARNSS